MLLFWWPLGTLVFAWMDSQILTCNLCSRTTHITGQHHRRRLIRTSFRKHIDLSKHTSAAAAVLQKFLITISMARSLTAY